MSKTCIRSTSLLTACLLAGLALMSGCKKQANQPTNLSVANLGSPVRVSSGDSDAAEPAMAVARDGSAYVLWIEHHGKEADVMLKHVNGEGQALGATAGATLSIGTDGAVQVLWYSEGQNGQTGLYWSASRDHGASFGPRQLLAAGTVSGTPVLIGDAKTLTAVWQDAEKNNEGVMMAQGFSGAAAPARLVASNGRLPACASNRERVFVAYIAKGAKGQDIWLVTIG
jgi:hypothetical protein